MMAFSQKELCLAGRKSACSPVGVSISGSLIPTDEVTAWSVKIGCWAAYSETHDGEPISGEQYVFFELELTSSGSGYEISCWICGMLPATLWMQMSGSPVGADDVARPAWPVLRSILNKSCMRQAEDAPRRRYNVFGGLSCPNWSDLLKWWILIQHKWEWFGS